MSYHHRGEPDHTTLTLIVVDVIIVVTVLLMSHLSGFDQFLFNLLTLLLWH